MNELLAAALLLCGALDFVTILIKLTKIHSALLFLFAPTDATTTTETATEHQRPKPDETDQGEKTGLQRSSARGIHDDQSSDDSHQKSWRGNHEQNVARFPLR